MNSRSAKLRRGRREFRDDAIAARDQHGSGRGIGVERGGDGIGIALAALVAPDLLLVQGQLQPFNPKLLAGLAVIAVALRTRKPWLPFVLGMAVLIGLRQGLGMGG